MKKGLYSLLLLLVCIPGFSQNSRYNYNGRYTPSIKKENLGEARFISEIMPEFSRYVVLPNSDRTQLDWRILVYPQDYYYPIENNTVKLDIVSIELSGSCGGKVMTALSYSDTLTKEQKNIINTVDLGSDIRIKLSFTDKNLVKGNPGQSTKIQEGYYTVTVIPEKEAEYPGGYAQISAYLAGNVFDKITGTKTLREVQQSIVKFTVNEEGQVVDTKIYVGSKNPEVNNLLLDATQKMPKWKPAENSMGIKVKQEFTIPFGGGGC
jgi:TonB family protein